MTPTSQRYLRRLRASIRLLVVVAVVGQLLVAGTAVAAAATDTGDSAAEKVKVLSGNQSYPNGFTVPKGEVWRFDPGTTTKVTVSQNVVVHGKLEMKPANRQVEHTLTFIGIDESKFVGGGAAVQASDVGLWVMDTGLLDIQGTPKTAWSYTYQKDWAGDEVRATPVTKGNYTGFPTVTATPSPNGLGYRPELLNLTRNVTIQGTASGKTHIFIHAPNASAPQVIKHAAIRHVAPDLHGGDGRNGTDMTGRYGLHFHMNGWRTSRSVVEGVVIRNADNHAFVPHGSHGIRFTDTIAYNTTADAYWWDQSTQVACGENRGCNATHSTLYDGIVAALTHTSPYSKTTSASIQLGEGDNNTIINSVAVGQQGGGQNNSGFKWPSAEDGVWKFQNNVAHNNSANGIFVWQNTSSTHVVNDFVAYFNHKVGIDHGAYGNAYVYLNLDLRGNERGAVESHALGAAGSDGKTSTQRWASVDTGGAGTLIPLPHNPGPKSKPVRFTHCDFALVEFKEFQAAGSKSTAKPGMYDFVECGLGVGDFDLTGAANGTVIRVQDGASAYKLTGEGAKTTIDPFFTVNPAPPPVPPPGRVPPPPLPPLGPPSGGVGFIDIDGSVFADDIVWLAAKGITVGCNPPLNDRFCPRDNVTRGQMAAFLDRALDLADGESRFTDVRGTTFEGNINALAAAGITVGCNPPGNDRFCPTDNVTRGQMAAFLVRAFDLPPGPARFGDTAGSVFAADIDALAAAGITVGCNPPRNDQFCPRDQVTRGQMAAFLHRAEHFLPR